MGWRDSLLKAFGIGSDVPSNADNSPEKTPETVIDAGKDSVFHLHGDIQLRTETDAHNNTTSVYEVGADGSERLISLYQCDDYGNVIHAEHYVNGETLTESFRAESYYTTDSVWLDVEKVSCVIGEVRNESGELIETRTYSVSDGLLDVDSALTPDKCKTYEREGDYTVETEYNSASPETIRTIIGPFNNITTDYITENGKHTETGMRIDGKDFYLKETSEGILETLNHYETRVGENGIDKTSIIIAKSPHGLEYISFRSETILQPRETSTDNAEHQGRNIITVKETYNPDGSLESRTITTDSDYCVNSDTLELKHEWLVQTFDGEGELKNEYGSGDAAEDARKVETIVSEDGSTIENIVEGDVLTCIETSPDGNLVITSVGEDTYLSYERDTMKAEYLVDGVVQCTIEIKFGEEGEAAYNREIHVTVYNEHGEIISQGDAELDETKLYTMKSEEIIAYAVDTALDSNLLDKDIPSAKTFEISSNTSYIEFDGRMYCKVEGLETPDTQTWETKDGTAMHRITTETAEDGKIRITEYHAEFTIEKTSHYEGNEKSETRIDVSYTYDKDGNPTETQVDKTYTERGDADFHYTTYGRNVEVHEIYRDGKCVWCDNKDTYSYFDADWDKGSFHDTKTDIREENGSVIREEITFRGKTDFGGTISDTEITKKITIENEDGSKTEIKEEYAVVDGEVVLQSHTETDYNENGDKVETRISEYTQDKETGDYIKNETVLDADDEVKEKSVDTVPSEEMPTIDADIFEDLEEYVDQCAQPEEDDSDGPDY